ncbi:hypothetical protein PT286_05960 [Neisseriaceae bacterium ESL0693]|nr:hypothetical protein [Neisseriaceae bacterium ESL0693]
MTKTSTIVLTVIFGLSGLAGCANTNTLRGDVYTPGQAKTAQSVSYGTIIAVNEAKIQSDSTGIGGLGGGVIGGIAGSGVGGGKGANIISAVGAVGGMILGNKLEQQANLTKASQLTIRRDNGEEFVVVQKYDPRLTTGARVRIVGTGSSLNVTPY